jgi:mannose-6-phosphate isomerase-like protein (cupin superfamily)
MIRPWGEYQVLGENPVCVKVITVNPNSRLSLQVHEHRSEIWFALESGLTAIVGDNLVALEPLQRIRVGQGEKHRLINDTDKPLQVIELMYGVYDENDIFRLEDDYDRN